MPSIIKPAIPLMPLAKNDLGLTIRDYEGSMSTLCAGCGHDSITAAIIRSFFEMSLPPERIAKISGIGCSSKTPTYFVSGAHGFNSVHGRMPSIATGANAANRSSIYIGISGDGDSLSIGAGQLVHAIRRNVDMVYLIENNGVYGLTKGQFSATADVGSRAKKGKANKVTPIDPALLAISLGASFVARSFSGDKEQLVPILKAAISHRGFALIDVISPCVQFNNHNGSTKSYSYVREHELKDIEASYVGEFSEITADLTQGNLTSVTLHDGSEVVFRSLPAGYDSHSRESAIAYINRAVARNEIPTGLLFIDEQAPDMHQVLETTSEALVDLSYESLCPGGGQLEKFNQSFK